MESNENNEEIAKAYECIVEYIENEIQKLESLTKSAGEETYNNFQLNKEYIRSLLIENYIREKVIPNINKLSIYGIKKQIDKVDTDEERYYDCIFYYVKEYIEPIETSIILLSNEYNENKEPTEELDEKVKLILQQRGVIFESNIDIVKEVTNSINDKMLEFDRASQIDINILSVYQTFIKTIQLIIMNYSNDIYVDIPFKPNNASIRKFGNDLGILTQDIIINNFSSINPKLVHNLLDIDELLNQYESGTIEYKASKYLLKTDYMKRYIEHYKNGDIEKSKMYLNNFSIRDIINSFKTWEISYEQLLEIITTKDFLGSRKHKVRDELKKIFVQGKTKEAPEDPHDYQMFRPRQLLELAKLGYISDYNLMATVKTQEDYKKKYSSTTLFEYEFITDEEICKYFNAERFLYHYFRPKSLDFNVMLAFYRRYILIPKEKPEEFEKFGEELIENENVQAKDIVKFYSLGLIYHIKMKELSDKNQEIKNEFYKFIKNEPMKNVFFIVNKGGLNEDDLIEIYGDDYELILREAIKNGLLLFFHFKKFSYLENSSIILEEYEKAIDEHQEDFEIPDKDIKRINYNDIMATYLSSDNLISLSDIEKMLRDHKDPIFLEEDFELGKSICNIIKWIHNNMPEVNMIHKIRQLYMQSYLTSDELNKLAEDGIIEYDKAKQIDSDFTNSKRFEELKKVKLGDSDAILTNSNPIPNPNKSKRIHLNKTGPTDKQILQGETIIKYLESLGFYAKSTTNAYGIEEMDTFDSGDFKDYRVFISDENPGVVILSHLKQIQNTDTYYHVGGNATYLMTTSQFFQYLKATGKINCELASFNTSKSKAKESEHTRTANVGQTWTSTIPRKISQLLSIFDKPELRDIKDSNFSIDTLLSDRLSTEERATRLKIIEECKKEFEDTRLLEEV